MDQNQPISPCNGDAISASVRIMARSLQHRRVAWMHDFRDSPTRRSSHSTNPEVERRRPRRDTAPPNFRVFKVNQPVGYFPTPGDAIPSNGLPPRPPPGQFRSRFPDRTTPFLATNHPANTPDSPESPRFILRESPPDQPVAVEEAPVFEGAAG